MITIGDHRLTPPGIVDAIGPVVMFTRFHHRQSLGIRKQTLRIRHAFAETANKNKGRDSRHALCGLLRRSGRDNPQTFGFKVAAARPHQAHPNQMARATANVSGNNQIVSGLKNLPRSGARKQIQ